MIGFGILLTALFFVWCGFGTMVGLVVAEELELSRKWFVPVVLLWPLSFLFMMGKEAWEDWGD